MIKTTEYYRLLCKGRKNLSLIILLSKTCTSLTLVGGLSGLAIILIRWLNKGSEISFDCLGLWLLFTLVVGGGLGLLLASRHRLDYHLTARWLDQNLTLHEVLTAADLCLARSCVGPFDEHIVEQAELCAGQINHDPQYMIKWPTKNLNKQMKTACLTIAISVFLIAYWKPQESGSISLQELTLPQEVTEAWEEPVEDGEMMIDFSTEKLLEMLFSFHPELARQAEEALNSGDVRAFREVLEYAEHKIGADLAEAQTFSDREALMQQLKLANEAKQRLGEKGTNGQKREENQDRGTQQRPEEPNQEGTKTSSEKPEDRGDSEREKTERGPEGSNFRSEQGAESLESQQTLGDPALTPNQQQNGVFADGERRADKKPGSGRGEGEGDWGDLSADLNKQAIIEEREDGKVFEYVLPGNDGSVPLINFIPVLQQTSETALEKAEIPVEYGEFVKNYYLQLLQEVSTQPEN